MSNAFVHPVREFHAFFLLHLHAGRARFALGPPLKIFILIFFHIKIKDRCYVERNNLREKQSADNGKPEWTS